jgi:hypothetical protein
VKNFDLKTFIEIFHILCDGVDMINSIFTPHLLSCFGLIIALEIFGCHALFRNAILIQEFSLNMSHAVRSEKFKRSIMTITINVIYLILFSLMRASAAHIGHTTAKAGSNTKILMARITNSLSQNTLIKIDAFHGLIQLQSRDVRIQNSFFVIDWKLMLNVS